MNAWALAASKRAAALIARDEFWRILERHKSRVARGEDGLAGAVAEASARMWAAQVEYSIALKAAEKSGEPHPEDDNGC